MLNRLISLPHILYSNNTYLINRKPSTRINRTSFKMQAMAHFQIAVFHTWIKHFNLWQICSFPSHLFTLSLSVSLVDSIDWRLAWQALNQLSRYIFLAWLVDIESLVQLVCSALLTVWLLVAMENVTWTLQHGIGLSTFISLNCYLVCIYGYVFIWDFNVLKFDVCYWLKAFLLHTKLHRKSFSKAHGKQPIKKNSACIIYCQY